MKWLIPAGLVVVALVVVLVFVVGGDDAPAGPPAGSAEAAGAVAKILDGANMDDPTYAEIDCPVDMSKVMALAPDSSTIAEVEGEGTFAAVLQPEGTQLPLIECSFEGDGGRLAGVSLGRSPGVDAFQAAMVDYLPSHELTFADSRSWRGGTLFTYCGVPTYDAEENGFDKFCEADWVTDDLVIGVFASPPLADEQQVRAWLDASLDEIVSQLAG